ncbi:GAF domain-containing protein [Leptolyngbya sp. FACHB-36]|uniref:methyl-accepting chemotaxis protein n=1 Tax=Leptolyngbya sp. FACHB-36 TaxID=2692808 RepID=UPI001680BDA9|nr:methyl-accepting chemotaxis protein [Leptolyngbya sp. FACHB-36]MBD2022067.1 GAF domain-containing protein [Leptolyngbya sp. FACHB-36]
MVKPIDINRSSNSAARPQPSSSPIVPTDTASLSASSAPATTNSAQSRSQRKRRGVRASLRARATAVAVAIGTIPVLGIGALAYYFADQSFRQETGDAQLAFTNQLSDKINRFVFERYGDIQVLAQLPFLSLGKVRDATSPEEKQAVLDRYVETSRIYRSVAVVDLDGKVLIQSSGDSLPSQKDQAYFQTVLKTDRPFIGREISPTLINQKPEMYFAAPVKDWVSGKTIAIVRTVVPLQKLEEVVQRYQLGNRDYELTDSTGNIFLASRKELIGLPLSSTLDGLDRIKADKKPTTLVTTQKQTNVEELVSYVPGTTLEGLPPLDWEVLMTVDTSTAFLPQRNLLITLALGTGITALLVGSIAALLARRATRPILEAAAVVQEFGQGNLSPRLRVDGDDELATLGSNINQMALQLQALLQKQTRSAQRSQLLSEIVLNIRRSLSYDDILQTSVDEIRVFLNTDRVLIYRFNEDWHSGVITAESVGPGWIRAMGQTILDPLGPNDVARYSTGRIWSTEDIHNENLTKCHCEILERLQVKANIVAPVMRNKQLIALICAHQCSGPRKWDVEEVEFFGQLAAQIGFALDQAYLLEQTDSARQIAETLSEERQHQRDELQRQLLDLLGEVEGAAMGDLTVRADVTAGDIGTVADFFNSIVESLRDIVTQVKQAATQVNQSLGDNEQSIRQLADGALQQAEETTRTLDSVEQMMRSIQAVADSASQAATVTRTAASTAESSGTAMDLTVQNILNLRETIGETAKKVKRLGESSQQISKVVSLINQIAMQTNLLAINAGIEAARAGEEGQGFAVVAEEVGELAARSSAATKEIEQIVATIQRETSEVVEAMEQGTTQVVEGTRLVEDAKLSLQEILTVFHQIDQLVQFISDATVSQVETSQTITTLMEDIAVEAGRTSNSSRQVSEALNQTVEVAKELQASVETFKVN